ncbi:7404_t:CDS:2, partial [Gigaspora rosea]
GYGKVYKAIWKSGPIESYDNKKQRWNRVGETGIVLKSIKNLENVEKDFFNEIETQMTSCGQFSYIIRCYGITQCPNTGNYMMIMDYKKDGSLRNYLDKNFNLLKWSQKLDLLYTAIKGLFEIHEKKLLGNYKIDKDHEIWKQIDKIEKNKNFDISPQEASLKYETSKQAFYTSKRYDLSAMASNTTIKRLSLPPESSNY